MLLIATQCYVGSQCKSLPQHYLGLIKVDYSHLNEGPTMIAFLSVILVVLLAIVQLQHSSAFAPLKTRALMKPLAAFDFNSVLLTAVEVAEKADDYQYGAVAAPSWALPLGAVLVIFTAAIPVLLKPGEEVCYQHALQRNPHFALVFIPHLALMSIAYSRILTHLKAIAEQRKNEEIMGSNFNKRKNKDLR
jgi:hypothetical protein